MTSLATYRKIEKPISGYYFVKTCRCQTRLKYNFINRRYVINCYIIQLKMRGRDAAIIHFNNRWWFVFRCLLNTVITLSNYFL